MKENYKKLMYIDFNKTVILLAILMLLLPIIVYIIRLIVPNMVRCIYYELTLKPCPFCGITTDLRNIIKGNIFSYKYNILSIPLVVGGIIEIICRLFILFKFKTGLSDSIMNKLIKYDSIFHIFIFIIILIYCILYFTLNLSRI